MKKSDLESILAIAWTIGAIAFFFCAASGIFKGVDSLQTHITQGLFDITMIIIGFYWGNSMKKGKDNTEN